MRVYIYIYTCYLCRYQTDMYIYMYRIYIYIHTYIQICGERAERGERERESEGGREGGRERKRDEQRKSTSSFGRRLKDILKKRLEAKTLSALKATCWH